MDELTKYVLDHLQALSGFDVVLMLLIASLVSTAAVIGLRRLYQTRYDAQHELLELRESTVQAFKDRVAEEEEASKGHRHELEKIKEAANKHQTEVSAAQEKAAGLGKMIEALAETGVPTQESFYQLQRLYLLQRLLNGARASVQTYCEFLVRSGESIHKAIALSKRLDEAADKFGTIDEEIVKLALPMPGSFRKGVQTPAAYIDFPYREVEAIINEVVEVAHDGIRNPASAHRKDGAARVGAPSSRTQTRE